MKNRMVDWDPQSTVGLRQGYADGRIEGIIVYWKQLKSLLFHKWHVLKVGLVVENIPLWRLIIHDWSKFSPIEFVYYAQYKYGVRYKGQEEKYKRRWASSWLHHLHHNPHHPEHWILSWRGDPDFYDTLGEGVASFITVLAMPETYVREMVVDMMATSKQRTGSYDIAVWLNKNGPKIRLHNKTKTRLDRVMHEIGYFLPDNCLWSYVLYSWKKL